MKTLIIAEIGVNHNGQEDMARQLIDAAAAAGADVVKFQSFKADTLATRAATLASYQKKAVAATDQNAMLRALELREESHRRLLDYAAVKQIGFLSSPFDIEHVEFLAKELGLPSLKIASGEITNGPLLLACARSNRRLLLSTGMSTLNEIEDALRVLALGFLHQEGRPDGALLSKAFDSAAGKAKLAEKVALLHCCSCYPAPLDEVHLRAIGLLKDRFGLEVGFSDHTTSIAVPVAAVAAGATVIEKHFTLSNSLEGPDHAMSLAPDRFAQMVQGIREVELALGLRQKIPTPAETPNRALVRRSLVARDRIEKGDAFTEENLTSKRPGQGISPMEYWQYLDRPASRSYDRDDVIAP